MTLDTPINRGDQTITRVQVRKPNAGALRGLSLVEVLQMNVTALQTLLPRVTEPPRGPHVCRVTGCSPRLSITASRPGMESRRW